MLKNYIVTAVRTLLKHRLYTIINIFGLAFGLGLCMTALSYVVYEFSFETCHDNRDNIYRVEATYSHVDTVINHARMMPPLGDAIVEEIPGVETAAVFRLWREVGIEIDLREYGSARAIFARPDFFDVFTLELLAGDIQSALTQPYSVIISDSAAKAYFPGQAPIGQVIEFGDQFEAQVTGIMKDIPTNTQIHCPFIISYPTLESIGEGHNEWTEIGYALTYLLLADGTDPDAVLAGIKPVVDRYLPPEMADRYEFRLKHLDDIYFDAYYSGNRGEIYPGGEYDVLIMIICLSLFILIQAIANFINLSTARSADRAKEVGVRKTLGAVRSQLIKQYLSESLVIAIIAMFLALGLHEFFKIGLYSIMPYGSLAELYTEPAMILSAIGLILTTGLLAGFYPALYLSRFKPVTVLQSKAVTRSSKSWTRRSLVVFQFTLAIFFVICTVIIFRQATFVNNFDLGFDRDNMLVLKFEGDDAGDNCELMHSEMLAQSGVLAATRTDHALGTRTSTSYGFYLNPERKREEMIVVKKYDADYDFLSAFRIEVVQGRGFTEDHPDDIDHAVLINESMARELEMEHPIGSYIYSGDEDFEIVGVVKDFHGTSFDYTYKSMAVIMLDPQNCDVLIAKMAPNGISGTVAAINDIWNRAIPNQTFSYTFLDQEIRAAYKEMNDMMGMFGLLALIAILIASLGIFGLVSYTAEQKTKEIGIRKVMGASVSSIISMLAREIGILIVIANVIAWPLAYLMLDMYLQEFPYRVSLGVGTFGSGGLLAIVLAMLTAGYQSLRAAQANPVDALRYE